ncbi:MAG: hypothetical protein KY468_14505 [Armatimonadetes bacterium]|nr:hypothetical protein [Armatimonadota bacterium]
MPMSDGPGYHVQDQNLFQLGDTLLLLTIERQSILINEQIAGFVEILYDRELKRSEARIWLYPQYRSYAVPVRRWIEKSAVASRVYEASPAEMGIVRFEQRSPGTETLEEEWTVDLHTDRSWGYEIILTDRLTGFYYPVHTTKNKREAQSLKREIEADLLILSADAFAEKWGLQRIIRN